MKKIIYVILLLFLATSNLCGQAILGNKTGVKHKVKLIHEETGKEIVIIPMIHVAKKEFFDEVKDHLDALKSEGYVVFYEGVTLPQRNIDSMKMDTIYRKFRRVTRFHLTDYTDVNNKSIPEKYKKEGHVMQTLGNLGLTTDKDIRVDLLLPELIEMYENKYREIELTDCDMLTELNDKYKCKKAKEHSRFMLLVSFREDHIFNTVKQTDYQKIILLYGQAHKQRLSFNLINLLGYKKVK